MREKSVRREGLHSTFSALRSLHTVDIVMVDRLHWWRSQHEAFVAKDAQHVLPSHSYSAPEAAATRVTSLVSPPLPPLNLQSWQRQRAHSVPLRGALCRRHSGRRLALPPRVAIALRHLHVLVFVRGEATVEDRDAVQMALREEEGAVCLTQLLPMERDFYGSQLRPHGTCASCCFTSASKSRRRAVSTPAIPSPCMGIRSGEKNGDSNNKNVGRRGSKAPYRGGVRGATVLSNKDGEAALQDLHPAHRCRKVASLQELYVFHPGVDFVGDGAFSKVFRAIPLFRGGHKGEFFAIKVIPRRMWGGTGLPAPSEVPISENKGGDIRKDRLRHSRADSVQRIRRAEMLHRYGPSVEQDAVRRKFVEIEREIAILRSLHHGGCSQFVEALRTPDEFVIVMKMDRGSLDARRYLHMHGPPSEVRVALIVYQLVEIVKYLQHTQGLIHRDIKLENVLLSPLDVSRKQIQGILGSDASRQKRGMSSSSTRLDDDKQTEGHDKNQENSNKTSSCSSSIWGSVSSGMSALDVERMLKVTLIDFGLARHTMRRGDRHRARGVYDCNTNRSVSCNGEGNNSNNIRFGMPTPLPSATNMFISVNSENECETCVSSTEFAPSEATSSYASSSDRGLDVVAEEKNVTNSDDATAVDSPSFLPLAPTPVIGATATTAASTSAVVAVAEASPTAVGGEINVVSVQWEGTEEAGSLQDLASNSRAVVGVSRGVGEEVVTRGPDSALRFDGLPNSPKAAGTTCLSAHSGGNGEGDACGRLWCENEQDERDFLLSLSPCGTDKYLPPEMLQWIVASGWERKPTPLWMARQLDAYAIGVVAYVLLSGCFPFNGASRATMVQQQQRCTPKCNSDHWRHVSPKAISFVQSLLEPDPVVRSTVSEALEHPWLRHAAQLADKLGLVPLPEEMLAGSRASARSRSAAKSSRRRSPPPPPMQRGAASPAAQLQTDLPPITPTEGGLQPKGTGVGSDDAIHYYHQSNAAIQHSPCCMEGTRLTLGVSQHSESMCADSDTSASINVNRENTSTGSTSKPFIFSQAPNMISGPSPTATSLLTQIAATQGLFFDDSTSLVPSLFSMTQDAEFCTEDDDDPFARMFKNVISK